MNDGPNTAARKSPARTGLESLIARVERPPITGPPITGPPIIGPPITGPLLLRAGYTLANFSAELVALRTQFAAVTEAENGLTIRMSPGPSYDAAAASVIGSQPPGSAGTTTLAGLGSPGDVASFKNVRHPHHQQRSRQ